MRTFLEFAATDGQTPGSGVGQLPPGYLPLTAANGLGSLASYTEAAAQDVAAQNGQLPSVVVVISGTTGGSDDATPTGAPTTSTSPQSFPFQFDSILTPFLTGHSLLAAHAAAGAHASGHPLAPEMVSSVLHPAGLLWTSGFPVVLLFALGAAGALGVPLTFRLGRRRGRW